MMGLMISNMNIREGILEDDMYKYMFSVEEVNQKVIDGSSFRDAYREVASDIDEGRYRPGRDHSYTHLGSIGNPGTEAVKAKLEKAVEGFGFVETSEVVNAMSNYFDKS